MSYARFADGSDIYLFWSVGDFMDCCGCWLHDEDETVPRTFRSMDDTIAHLRAHVAAGHQVPDDIYDRLAADREEFDAAAGPGLKEGTT